MENLVNSARPTDSTGATHGPAGTRTAFVSAFGHRALRAAGCPQPIVSKQTGRGSTYMGAVSSTLIALGFLAQVVTRLDPFVAGLLPALFVLGELIFAAPVRYRGRNVVEWCFNRLEQFRAVATRFDKRAANHQAMVVIASLLLWLER
jgi:hypothetical protein